MNRIRIENKLYIAPSSWNEMTRKQLFAWCGIIRQRLDPEQALDAAVMLLYSIPLDTFAKLKDVQRLQLRYTLDWLVAKNQLTENVIGSLRLLGRKYHGPAGRLANLTIDEYRRTELWYQLWVRKHDSNVLRMLAATLFRPAGPSRDDDERERLNEKRIARRAQLFRLMHPNWLHAILLYYEGCRALIIRKNPRVFRKGKEGVDIGGLMDLDAHILAYSGDKLGAYTETRETNVHVFFKHATQRLEEYEEMQARLKK